MVGRRLGEDGLRGSGRTMCGRASPGSLRIWSMEASPDLRSASRTYNEQLGRKVGFMASETAMALA